MHMYVFTYIYAARPLSAGQNGCELPVVWQWLRIAAARPVSAAQLRTSAAWPLEQELRNTTTGPARQWMRIS